MRPGETTNGPTCGASAKGDPNVHSLPSPTPGPFTLLRKEISAVAGRAAYGNLVSGTQLSRCHFGSSRRRLVATTDR